MWWVSVLRDPTLDNGSDDPIMRVLIAISNEARPPVSTHALKQFATILAEQLNQQLDSCDPDDYSFHYRISISIGVDYGPDALLSECAEQAGLRGGITSWPRKTHMSVKRDEVSVSYGYGAKPEVIWTKQS